jgi:hypothetical protein
MKIELVANIDTSKMTAYEVEQFKQELEAKETILNLFYNLHPSHHLRNAYQKYFGNLGNKDADIEIGNIQFLIENLGK